MILNKTIITMVLLLSSSFVHAEKISFSPEINNILSKYPDRQDNLSRNFIVLPPLESEHNYKVEVFFGKYLMVDCNPKLLQSDIPQKIKLGDSAYNYYLLNSVSVSSSSGNKCLNNQKIRQFTPSLNSTLLLPYNSETPLIFYTPRDIQVKYRILFPSQFQDGYKG